MRERDGALRENAELNGQLDAVNNRADMLMEEAGKERSRSDDMLQHIKNSQRN
jgi:predicted S18 family serine protease